MQNGSWMLQPCLLLLIPVSGGWLAGGGCAFHRAAEEAPGGEGEGEGLAGEGEGEGDPAPEGEGEGPPVCPDPCELRALRCGPTARVQICTDPDGDGCPAWEDQPPCPAGWICTRGACAPSCVPECLPEDRGCRDGAVVHCGDPDRDGCPEWDGPVACEPGQRCEQGQCVPEAAPCTPECDTPGETRCGEGGVRTCGEYDDDPCPDLSLLAPCGEFQLCLNGQCLDACQDDCENGEVSCQENAVVVCGYFTGDGCLGFGPPTPCGTGLRCQEGECVREPCQDRCPEQATRCTPNGRLETCQRTAEGCLDWSAPRACPAGQTCEGGACRAGCEEECQLGERKCAGAGHILTCGNFDADPCLEFGDRAPCGAGQICEDRECRAIGCQQACEPWQRCVEQTCRPAVLINEVFYDEVGNDGPQVFIELWGPAGLSLEGFSLQHVNADGRLGDRLALVHRIHDDGYYLITTPAAKPELLARATQVDGFADLQNAPDALQLWRGQQPQDALAYCSDQEQVCQGGEGDWAPRVAAGQSLTRDQDHTDTDDNASDFSPCQTPTPGRPGCE